jgi:subtilisin-like proprotein convertase family protein
MTEVTQGARVRPRDEVRGALAKRSRLRRLALEGLEARTLMAVTPVPTVSNQVAASAGAAGTTINDSSPSIAVDPLDPSKLVAVFTDRNTASGTTEFSAQVTFSTDGGLTWNGTTSPRQSGDPTSTTGALLQDTAEGVGFDRNGNFFVGVLETNSSNAGDVVVDRYSFTGAAPTPNAPFAQWGSPGAVYSWDQALTGANLQPSVVNFSMAVDSNVSSYVDPTSHATQSDPNSGAVYIGWTLDTPPPSPAPSPYNPFTIQVLASSDGLSWPTSGITGVTGAGQLHVGTGNVGNQHLTDPQIAVSQGKVNGTDGGQVSVIWDDYGTGSVDGTNQDHLFFAALSYKAGALSSPTPNPPSPFASTTVRGAQTGTNFPLATPSSPIGIGPGAVIAVDNTLGSFSQFQGRIYVAFVNRSTAAGNPTDNTDIDLVFSSNDGATWTSVGTVNNDNGQTDGHTSGNAGAFGRPQYEPSIAVDNTNGTLVMSWLDVRDDASLGRYANYLTTSITGGTSFSQQTFADQPNLVTNAVTDQTFVAGPYSGDESGGNPDAETTTAFGAHQGLAVVGGVIHPIWATTVQTGLTRADSNLTIQTAQASVPSGPRIVSGTSGKIAGTSFQNFTVTFDRPISIASFTASAVQVQYLNALTGLTSSVALSPTNPIVAINPQGFGNMEATQFRINLAAVQTGVGTYSYSIDGGSIEDLFQTAGGTTNTPDAPGTAMEVASAPNVPQPITDAAPATSTTTSTILVSGVANGIFVQSVIPDISINYPNDADLTVTLTSPANVVVTLIANGTATGANFTNTAFSDGAPQTIAGGTAPYTGLFQPAQALAAFANGVVDGAWTLTVTDSNNSGKVGSLVTWSLSIATTPSAQPTFGNPTPAPAAIRDSPAATSTTTSTIALSGVPPADVVATGQAVTISNLTIQYPSTGTLPVGANPTPLTIELVSPGGQTQVITTSGPVGALSSATFTSNLFAGDPLDGTWTLKIIDSNNDGVVGSLVNWSLQVNAGKLVSGTASPGNQMDQNPGVDNIVDGSKQREGDFFANPSPLNPANDTPFEAPYDSTTLPIIIGGPTLASTFVAAPITNTPLPTVSTIVVSGAPVGDTVKSVTVSGISLTYPNDANLQLVLTAPNGTAVTLVQGLIGSNFVGTGFSDTGGSSLATAVAPFTGTFTPMSPLAGLAGAPVNGNWSLTVIDSATGTTVGSLTGWSVNVVPTVLVPKLTYTTPSPLPAPITDIPLTASTVVVSGAPAGDTVQSLTVSGVTLTYPNNAALSLVLTSPNGTSTVLAAPGTLSGSGLANASFSVPTAMAGATVNGNWKLTVLDSATGTAVGSLKNWSLSIVPTVAATLAFAPPTLIGVTDPAGSAQTGNNLVLNGTASAIDVTFDQPMNPATFTGSQVLSIMGPTGAISGPFIVTPDPQPGENASFPKTFQIRFPTQQLSGTYNITLGAGIQAQTGAAMDTNQNAGVDLLFTNASSTLPAGPSTFTSTQVLPISSADTPDSPLVSTITIPAGDDLLIQDLSVSLNIVYSNDPDLTATLTTPDGQTITLFSNNGSAAGSQANFTNTVFDDNAATLIQNGAPPFFGQFKPIQSLLVQGHLAGANEAGTYTLTITDSTTGSTAGTLNGWSITTTPETTTNTGLGEPVADQSTASFRIFTMDPTNPLSANTWTAVGPASNNSQGNSGRVSAIAVDQSDPSGNTVYVAGASGGIWKTTDFLTTNPLGPTYTLLTGNSEADALNIGSIAVYSRNNDPGQSIIVAGTGEGNTAQPGVQGSSTVGTSAGVGFLVSYDGGKTWTLDDSLVNYDALGNELPESKRDHQFVGSTTYKVIIDPSPEPNGNIIIYAALGGGQTGQGSGGIFRSIDSGHTWQLMKAGYATDVIFDPNSGSLNAVNNPTGNLQTIYGAFLGQGIFLSPNQGNTWNSMTGGVGDPLVQNIPLSGKPAPVPVTAPGATPSSGGGRIVLAKPALTGNALLDAEYETWLYAGVVNPDGSFNGLFVTKDNGANWTDVRIPNAAPGSATAEQGINPSNNIGLTNYNITGSQGNYDFALAVDPTNPNILYVGGSADFGPATMIRVDITRLADPYSLYASGEAGGDQTLPFNTSPVSVPAANLANFSGELETGEGFPDPLSEPFTNIYRNPADIFDPDSTVLVTDTASFSNDGSGAWYTPMDSFIGGTDVHVILAIKDPVTGLSRMIVGYDQGVATAVDDNGTTLAAIGTTKLTDGVANGNLQITQFYNGAAQPSALAAQVAGALFYGMAQDDGFPESDPNVLTNGNIGWAGSTGDGTDVVTDQTGTGTTYETQWPCCNPVGPDEFFQVNGIGQTFGLLQSTSVPPGASLPGTPDPQWPFGPSFNFAVNPVDNNEVIIGSGAGRLFVTQDATQSAVIWTELAEPTVFDSTTIPALAYGAPTINATGGALGDYMMIGTTGGHIYVTFTGGGNGTGSNNWINISAGLDGSSVQRIVTDPTRGTFDAYAITSSGVFYNANTSAANSTWVNITGDLFKQTTTPFGDSNLTTQAVLNLGGLAADWRYVIPFDPTNPSKGTHPMLYVAGVGGVFRSTNNGTNWTAFPDQTLATPVPEGNLPSATISDLDMVLGNIDPTTGHPNVSTGPNLLLATTYGAGSYGIRLAPIIFNDSTNKVTETQNSAGVLNFQGLSEQSAFGTAVAVTVLDVTDPTNPIYLGGYNPVDGSPSASLTFATPGNQTDVNGVFNVSGVYPTAPNGNPFFYDGTRTVEVFATDASGTKGNVVTFQITNNLPTPTTTPVAPLGTGGPIFVNSNDSGPPLTNAVVSGGGVITTTAAPPTFQVVVPNPGAGNPISVSLIRVDSQSNAAIVGTVDLTGTAVGTTLTGYIQDTTNPPAGTYTYEYQYTVTIDGQPTNSPTSPTTTLQVVPLMTSPSLFFQDDSGIPSIPSTLSDGITNVTRPRIVGTAIPNKANDSTLTLELVEIGYTTGVAPGSVPTPLGTPAVLNTATVTVDPVNGQYLLQPSSPLAQGTYALAVVATDAAGDTVMSAPMTLTIDTTAPSGISGLALAAVPPSDIPGNNPNATVVRRPAVTGMTDPGAVVTIKGSVNGGPQVVLATTTAQAFNNGGHPAGFFQAQLPSNLTDGAVMLFAYAENAAGNTNPTPSTFFLKIISVTGDYTGVGTAGLAVYSPSTGTFAFAHAGTGITTTLPSFGLANVDIPVSEDYNGDGQTDPAIYRPTNGWWAIDVNSQAPTGQFVLYVPPIVSVTAFPNTIPAAADFDTDGQADPAVFTIINVNGVGMGVFTILHNEVSATNTATIQSVAWGLAGDLPVSADYDGSGAAQVAVYRSTTGAWYIRSSGAGNDQGTAAGKQEPAIFVTTHVAGDVADQADYDGIGRLEEAIYRPSTETFYIYNPNTKTTRSVVMPKLAGQGANDVIIPASADYTGDGKADATIFDQTLGEFEFVNSKTGTVTVAPFYLTKGDIPLAAPEQFRAAVGASASLRVANAFLVASPGSSSGSASSGSGTSTSTGAARAAVIVGATVPTGLTSTGKTNTLPPVPVPSPAPTLVVLSGTGSSRPAQGDATDDAISSMFGS